MKSEIISKLKGKSIVILGFGREGKSTLNFLLKNNVDCVIAIADKNEIVDEEYVNIIKEKNIAVHTGENYLDCIKDFDYIMKTPGISFKDVNVESIKDKIISQTELFLEFGKEKIIGVTGTKGKSTTSSLIFSMLSKKYNTKLIGNIGVPSFDLIDEYDITDYFVYELSSHQLEFVKHSPKYAVLLNMYEEHLDHYRSFEEYKEAKRNIYKYQDEGDIYVYNEDEKDVLNENHEIHSNMIGVTSKKVFKNNMCSYNQEEIEEILFNNTYVLKIPKNNLKGKHNIYNMAVAYTIAKLLWVDNDKIEEAIKEFKPLPHRLETVATINDITYIDDSIATIPEAVISSVESIPGIDTVLIGGMDRGINYSSLVEYISLGKIRNVILMYDSGKKIYESLMNKGYTSNVYYEETLEQAVKQAVSKTEKGKICMLSPASASYGVFKNFEERGDKFKEYVFKYAK